MTVRRATPDDFEAIAALWRQFDHEIPPPVHAEPTDADKELGEVADILARELAFLAEDEDGRGVGFALVRMRTPTLATLTDLYVDSQVRRRGVGTELARAVVDALRERGVEHVDLDVQVSNGVARSLYGRWGFRDDVIIMSAPVSHLAERLGQREARSFGSIHVQSDDLSGVEAAVRQFVPRLPGGSRGSLVAAPRNGWIAVYDDVCDRDPDMLRRLARELSDRMGSVVLLLGVEEEELLRMVLYERGRIVDEYLSVPEYHGPLPPGDVVGFAANPTVIHRLTGADAQEIRRIALTAPAPADLPPARELLRDLAAALKVEGSEHGWSDAPDLPGAVRIERS
jgi:ribosomal protein S18 acetylase RimI-like enzyme